MLFQSLNHCEMELMLKSIKSASSFRIPAYDVEKIKKIILSLMHRQFSMMFLLPAAMEITR